MMRFGTFFTLSVAVAAGIGLFHAKYRVQALESELAGLQREIQRDRESIHVLSAEWSYLNGPERLAEQARRHLELAPISGSQLATLDDVPEKLPLAGTEDAPPAEGGDESPSRAPDEPDRPAPLIAAAPVPAPAPASAPASAPTAPPAPSGFDALPADVQAVLASMRSAQ